jgi:hypothetical protein
MKADEDESLGSRLEAMAREHALTRWVGTALFGALAAFLAWHGLPSRSAVCTERLELRDRQGRLRASLAVDREHGTPHLVLFDADGRAGISLIAFDNGPVVSLSGPGESRVGLDATRLEVPALDLRAPGGRGGVALVAEEDGSLGLALQGGGRSGRWNVRPDERGRPRLEEWSGKGASPVGEPE